MWNVEQAPHCGCPMQCSQALLVFNTRMFMCYTNHLFIPFDVTMSTFVQIVSINICRSFWILPNFHSTVQRKEQRVPGCQGAFAAVLKKQLWILPTLEQRLISRRKEGKFSEVAT